MRNSSFRYFENPFENFTDKGLLISGLLGYLASIILGYFWNFSTIGYLHLQSSVDKSIFAVLCNKTINLLSLTLVLFLFGKSFYRKTRILDVFIAVMVAQIAFLVVEISLSFPYAQQVIKSIENSLANGEIELQSVSKFNLAFLSFAGVISLLGLVYYFFLLIKGIRIAVNSRKWYHGLIIVLLVFALDALLVSVNPYF